MNTALAELIIFKCDDEMGKEWEIVPPDEVPEKVKEPGVIAWMLDGFQPQFPGESTIYAGFRVGDKGVARLSGVIKDINGESLH